MKHLREIPSIFTALVSKILKGCLEAITSDISLLAVIVFGPFVLLAVILIFPNLFTLRQYGIIFQMFAVIPLAIELWERSKRSVTEFRWVADHIRNFAHHRKWQRITRWIDQHHTFNKVVEIIPFAIAFICYFVGLLLQFLF